MSKNRFWGRTYSARAIAEAKIREAIIVAWQQGGKLSELVKDCAIKLSRKGWWAVKQKYERHGFAGLLDRRGLAGGRTPRINDDQLQTIKDLVDQDVSLKEFQDLLQEKFSKIVSARHSTRLLKKLGITKKRGRPASAYSPSKHKGIPVDNAGVYFLKGADYDMEGSKTIVEQIVAARQNDIEQQSALKRIRGTTPPTITKKVESLLYLPMFDMQKPYHLLKYHKKGFGILTGSGKRYSYYTLDIFLCDIEKLKIANQVGDTLARRYLEALCIELELEDGSCFYIDGHAKHVWSSKNIPKAFFTTLKRAERGLHQYFIHSSKGDPLILLTCPGDTRLPGALFNLIDAFENAVGKKILRAAIFDREGLSLRIFEEFGTREKRFITLLRENMYKGEQSFRIVKDFKALKTEEINGELKILEWVADADYDLKDRETKKKLTVRVALVKKRVDGKEKLIPIITNINRKERRDVAWIAKKYFGRWPNQENMFRDAIEAFDIDTNHGYKKKVVDNRVAQRKKEELATNLRGISGRLESAQREREVAAKQLKNLEEVYKSRKGELQKDRSELHSKIGLTDDGKQRRKLLRELKQAENKLTKLGEQYGKQISDFRAALKKREKYEKSLRTQKANKENEIAGLDLDRALYEMETEKDHLMSNVKMLLTNLSSYAQRQYFPERCHTLNLESMKRTFWQQGGYVKERKRRIDVTLYSYDDAELQSAMEYACMKFNASDLRSWQGQRIWMHVELPEA